MDPALKEKWVKALRCGWYQQGFLAHRWGRGERARWSALGVLFDATDPWGWPMYYDHTSASLLLMDRMYGFTREMWVNVVLLNDRDHLSFNEIADWIEKEL